MINKSDLPPLKAFGYKPSIERVQKVYSRAWNYSVNSHHTYISQNSNTMQISQKEESIPINSRPGFTSKGMRIQNGLPIGASRNQKEAN